MSFRGEEGSTATASLRDKNTSIWACGAAVAQRTHNPLVAGSNPAGPKFLKKRAEKLFFFVLKAKK